jgi:hypothetical protein
MASYSNSSFSPAPAAAPMSGAYARAAAAAPYLATYPAYAGVSVTGCGGGGAARSPANSTLR